MRVLLMSLPFSKLHTLKGGTVDVFVPVRVLQRGPRVAWYKEEKPLGPDSLLIVCEKTRRTEAEHVMAQAMVMPAFCQLGEGARIEITRDDSAQLIQVYGVKRQ